ncbi:MAG: hypothetical protein WBY71_05300 [Nitrososphaeraceae archaeon]
MMKFNLFHRKKRFTYGRRKPFNAEEELTRHGQIEHSGKISRTEYTLVLITTRDRLKARIKLSNKDETNAVVTTEKIMESFCLIYIIFVR